MVRVARRQEQRGRCLLRARQHGRRRRLEEGERRWRGGGACRVHSAFRSLCQGRARIPCLRRALGAPWRMRRTTGEEVDAAELLFVEALERPEYPLVTPRRSAACAPCTPSKY